MLLFSLFDGTALACRCRPVSQGEPMQQIMSAALLYRAEFGRYPVTDEISTWFEKLVDADLVFRGPDAEAGLPLDMYGFPLVYELPAGAFADPADEAAWPILRCVGRNSRDDQGGQDDWDLRYGPNWGHWYKARWPQAVMLSPPVAILICILVWCARGRALRLVLALFLSGWGVAFLGHVADPMVTSGSSGLPRWAELAVAAGIIAGLAGGVGMVVWLFEWLGRLEARRLAAQAGQCHSCRYDLRGSASPVCPECGEPRIARMPGARVIP